ncbi:hypothetical protein DFP73DRAFT_542597 [Morchella snyderi]|nr:hypothetical protein DFP73DRAFT_542597 [Morchella snyderi]
MPLSLSLSALSRSLSSSLAAGSSETTVGCAPPRYVGAVVWLVGDEGKLTQPTSHSPPPRAGKRKNSNTPHQHPGSCL